MVRHPSVSLGRCLRYVPLGRDPGADRGPDGRTTSPSWHGNASGSPQRKWIMLLRIGNTGNLCLNCYSCNPISYKQPKINGGMINNQTNPYSRISNLAIWLTLFIRVIYIKQGMHQYIKKVI